METQPTPSVQGSSSARELKQAAREVVKNLTRNTLSKYFYMPIKQVARELNVGVTYLKNICRELGIRKWPYRKLMSLQTLINNVQVRS